MISSIFHLQKNCHQKGNLLLIAVLHYYFNARKSEKASKFLTQLNLDNKVNNILKLLTKKCTTGWLLIYNNFKYIFFLIFILSD